MTKSHGVVGPKLISTNENSSSRNVGFESSMPTDRSDTKLLKTKNNTQLGTSSIKKPKVKPIKPYQFKRLVESQKTEIHVRKNQIDFTAAIVYGLNVSLIHFALFVVIAFIVHYPDEEQAKAYDA